MTNPQEIPEQVTIELWCNNSYKGYHQVSKEMAERLIQIEKTGKMPSGKKNVMDFNVRIVK